MPDLRSALEKAIASWDDEAKNPSPTTLITMDTPTPTPAPSPIQAFTAPSKPLPEARTTGVSVALFNHIHAHPYTTIRESMFAMTEQGFNPTSIGSLVNQLVRRGYISRDKDNRLTALRDEYVVGHAGRKPGKKNTVKPESEPKKASAKVRRPLLPPVAETGLAALHAAPAPTGVTPNPPHIDYLLSSLNVGQAHALYLKLHKMFGG